MQRGYSVWVLQDGCGSRGHGAQGRCEEAVALARMRQAGAVVTTSEAVLFELVRDSSHARFKQLSAMIKAGSPWCN